MQIAKFPPTLHHPVKLTCQSRGFPLHLVGAEQDVSGSWFPSPGYSSLGLTHKAETGRSLASSFSLGELHLDRATAIILCWSRNLQ